MGRPPSAVLAAMLVAALSCARDTIVVDGGRMHARVVRQVAMGPRVPGTPGHAAVKQWIAAELSRTGGDVRLQEFVDTTLGRPLPLTNIIARYGPAQGAPIALLAHWDTRVAADRDPDPSRRTEPVPGANDGGSGVAVLLEVAELMSARPPRVPVELVFLDGEDQGRADRPEEFCLGSRGYAARLAATDRPRAAFVFDMVGDKDLAIHPEAISLQRAANLVEVVREAARATGARSFHDTPGLAVYDDHVPLLDAGVPAVDIIDFEYDAWHTRADTPDRVAPESLAEVARVAAWIVYRSALAR